MIRPYKLAEQKRWRQAYETLLAETPKYRASIIEECAREVGKLLATNEETKDILEAAIAAIRALRDKT